MVGRGKDVEKFLKAVFILATKGNLPVQYKAHKLRGEYAGYWECHLESDWLLVYTLTSETVFVARTGTHSDLFE
ncbi:MAG: Addiction module toxin, RelE/StbE family [Parcubacteria group bacterium GW2011_GWA1_47_8]|nr:MAG: Addiction module toxin, RelE/StbE family [Parcubacteria group bacterium GW2011_GWA1_47_8]